MKVQSIATLGILLAGALPLGCSTTANTTAPAATTTSVAAPAQAGSPTDAASPTIGASEYRAGRWWWPRPRPKASPTASPLPTPTPVPIPPSATPVPTLPPAMPTPIATATPTSIPTLGPAPVPTPVATPSPAPTPLATPNPAPTTVASPTPGVSTDAQAVLDLCNAQRAAVGVKPLALASPLMSIAQARAQDMVDRNYFAHIDPDGHDVFWYMQQAGINFMAAGENIAMGQRTPQEVVNAWMSDQGHRDNILNTSFAQLGVGIAHNASGTIYWVQDFTN